MLFAQKMGVPANSYGSEADVREALDAFDAGGGLIRLEDLLAALRAVDPQCGDADVAELLGLLDDGDKEGESVTIDGVVRVLLEF